MSGIAGQRRKAGPADDLPLLKETTLKLLAYCRARQWAGYDPYDALNSRLFGILPFLDFKLARFAMTQVVKRSALNLRPLLLIPRAPNPKGLALFLSSLVKLSKMGISDGEPLLPELADKLLALRSPGEARLCWGYHFDWQTRGELVPRWSPNIICSTFAANALLDAHDRSPNPKWLEAAESTAGFIMEKLFWRKSPSHACFSYTPLRRGEVHNANLLGAAFLCRVGRALGRREFIEPALDAARYSVSRQQADGAWAYGEGATQRWIDNFHTGFNLGALRRIGDDGGTAEFEPALRRGYEYYKARFFRDDGAPKYFHDAVYPIDIHSVAQSIITFVECEKSAAESYALASPVFRWAMANMWDPRGFFYFQKRRAYVVRTPFMRWSEAWMLWALAAFLESQRHA